MLFVHLPCSTRARQVIDIFRKFSVRYCFTYLYIVKQQPIVHEIFSKAFRMLHSTAVCWVLCSYLSVHYRRYTRALHSSLCSCFCDLGWVVHVSFSAMIYLRGVYICTVMPRSSLQSAPPKSESDMFAVSLACVTLERIVTEPIHATRAPSRETQFGVRRSRSGPCNVNNIISDLWYCGVFSHEILEAVQ